MEVLFNRATCSAKVNVITIPYNFQNWNVIFQFVIMLKFKLTVIMKEIPVLFTLVTLYMSFDLEKM